MRLFNFLKKKPKERSSAKETLERIIEYMPDFYRSLQFFKNSIEFVERNELSLAVKSLIRLTDATGHYFSEDFWSELGHAANMMNMPKEDEYCQSQILHNKNGIGWGTPFGWTTIKIDDTHFQHHISAKLKEEWATERREKDGVSKLINNNGVHIKSHGRSGITYFVDGPRVAELEFEQGAKALILYYDQLMNWSLPVKEIMTSAEKQELMTALQTWSKNTGSAISFE